MKYRNKLIWILGTISLLILNTKLWAYTHNWDLLWSIFNNYDLAIWLFTISLNYYVIGAIIIWALPFIKERDNV